MDSPFVGMWSYRSFFNNPDLSVPFNNLRFGMGTLTIEEPSTGVVAGTIGGPGWQLNLQGWLTYGNPFTIRFQGTGVIEFQGNGVSVKEDWAYDYLGFLSPHWPNGINQRPAIVGTIVRTLPHTQGQAPAGDVASWIAVRQ